jgi:hypothetical protein
MHRSDAWQCITDAGQKLAFNRPIEGGYVAKSNLIGSYANTVMYPDGRHPTEAPSLGTPSRLRPPPRVGFCVITFGHLSDHHCGYWDDGASSSTSWTSTQDQ